MTHPTGATARGRAGVLTVAGRTAAVLGPWTLTYTGEGWRAEADVRERDEHWLASGGPFRLLLRFNTTRALSWRGVAPERVECTDTTITITGEGEPD